MAQKISNVTMRQYVTIIQLCTQWLHK